MKDKIITGIVAASIGMIGVFVGAALQKGSTDEIKISEYYAQEVATLQSPHGLRKALADGSAAEKFVIVDVRSEEEYLDGHIVTAYSVPAYTNKDNTENTSEERVIEGFRELQKANPNKKLLIYCYSASCMTGRKVGDLLARNGIYSKELTVGWNEWRYFPNTWNYPHEWKDVDIMDYVASGTEPGEVPEGLAPKGCTLDGGLGC